MLKRRLLMETSNQIEFNLALSNIEYELHRDYMYTGEFFWDGACTWYKIKNKHNGHVAETNSHPHAFRENK